MKSAFFYEKKSATVAKRIKDYINKHEAFLTKETLHSPRAVGDSVQGLIETKFSTLAKEWIASYSSGFARRSMEDLAFEDKEGFYSAVDVKTHRSDTVFNMPALISVERLARFYEDDKNIFSIMMIKYDIMPPNRINVTDVIFCPIEFIKWSCLTVGALGWGQIQIANSNHIELNCGESRKRWMLSLCDVLSHFYPGEINKIKSRIDHFTNIKKLWKEKEGIWI